MPKEFPSRTAKVHCLLPRKVHIRLQHKIEAILLYCLQSGPEEPFPRNYEVYLSIFSLLFHEVGKSLLHSVIKSRFISAFNDEEKQIKINKIKVCLFASDRPGIPAVGADASLDSWSVFF